MTKLQEGKAVIGGMIMFMEKYGGITKEHKQSLEYLINQAEKGECIDWEKVKEIKVQDVKENLPT